MFSFLLAVALTGLFAAGVIAVVELVLFTIDWVINKSKAVLQKNNKNKLVIDSLNNVMVAGMKNSHNQTTLSQLEDIKKKFGNNAYISGVYNNETSKMEDIEVIKANKVDATIANAVTDEPLVVNA